MTIIQSILAQINDFVDDDNLTYFIMEPQGYPYFLQFAKIGENYILDVPAGNFFEEHMQQSMQELVQNKFRKEIVKINNQQNERLATYQVRFAENEINKMCYVANELFQKSLKVNDSAEIIISMR
tara:strand:+ start:108 stop:482 length:375 start_codon:yes stop_codon:yes gene_type:complete